MTDTFWMIETTISYATVWWTGGSGTLYEGNPEWTREWNDAVHFCRKTDAVAVAQRVHPHNWQIIITEHSEAGASTGAVTPSVAREKYDADRAR